MPVGFMITLVLLGVLVILALIRLRYFGSRLFILALPAGELPHFAIVYLGLSTLLAWHDSSLTGPVATVLFGVAGLLLFGLLVLLHRALQARRNIHQIIRKHGQQLVGSKIWWLRPLLFPFPWRPPSVLRTGRIMYGKDPRQRLDVYHPRKATTPGPVLVYFHGGGYSSGGNRREARTLLYHLCARGWTCISATYRLRPRFGFTDHLADAQTVLTWAHTHAGDYGGDTATVVMAGSSAGGHLTALCALNQHEHGFARVDAAVSLYAYYGRYYGRDENESPISTALALDASNAPPFFIVHGDHDSYVAVEEARQLRDHLVQNSAREPWYVELPGAQHGFDAFASWRFMAVIEGIDAFFNRELPRRHS